MTSSPSSRLIGALLDGDRSALSRAISLVERNAPDAGPVLKAVRHHLGRALVLGVTGPPGVGKSTLINALVGALRATERTVGIIAIDPSSALTGGAVLGDRIRMGDHAADEHVFIRSLGSRGHSGALAPMAGRVVDLMDAAGKDAVIVETVGAGQSDVDVFQLAEVTIVVEAPGWGDGVQALKAGVLEVADIIVVNKADRPGAQHLARELHSMLALRPSEDRDVAVLSTVATTGEGVHELLAAADKIVASGRHHGMRRDPALRVRRLVARAAGDLLTQRLLGATTPAVDALFASVHGGDVDVDSAAASLVDGLELGGEN